MSADREDIEREMAARALDPALEALVRRSPMFPESSWQHAMVRWLRDVTPEDRLHTQRMLEGVEARADAEAQDEALVDRILAGHQSKGR